MSDNSPSDPPGPLLLPPEFRFLKRLVTVLTATMIAGLLTIIALLVIRLAAPPAPAPDWPALPAAIRLPQGAQVSAITFAEGFTLVVTTQGEVLIYAPDGTLNQSLSLH
jgi:hypothetical protein